MKLVIRGRGIGRNCIGRKLKSTPKCGEMTVRINRIKLLNYRQFRELEIYFDSTNEIDLNILIGRNGAGKTNLLNAINWCLYGEESLLSKESMRLPVLNLNTIKETGDGKDVDVLVEVQFKTENNKFFSFTRKEVYRVYKEQKKPKLQETGFEAITIDDKGNSEILNEEDSIFFVERFVPNAIRDFFFFDGERLDNYFKRATSQNIRHAIFVISQIEFLENRIERRLEDIITEFRRDAGKLNPKIEETRNLLEEKDEEKDMLNKEIDECEEQKSIAKEGMKECEEKLRGIPDLERLEKDRLQLKSSRKHYRRRLEEKIKAKQDILFDIGKDIMLWPVIKEAIEMINEKRKNREIPPAVDASLLEDILESDICSICDRKLTKESKEKVKNIMNDIKLSSEIAYQLNEMQNPLILLKEKTEKFKTKIKSINNEIKSYETELKKTEERISKIDKHFAGYDAEKIKVWAEQLKKFEKEFENKSQKLGSLIPKRNKLEEELQTLERKNREEIEKEKKTEKISKLMDFSRKALDVTRETKEAIMRETRIRIEEITKELFFQLIWKKQTFKDIKISENYEIDLIHSLGYSCLGSISAAERELLALSFTIALHKVSGFDSPIMIDTPVARVSDEHRENLGKIFSNISGEKQFILLFTPAEYSADISRHLDKVTNTRYRLKLSSDEREIKLEAT